MKSNRDALLEETLSSIKKVIETGFSDLHSQKPEACDQIVEMLQSNISTLRMTIDLNPFSVRCDLVRVDGTASPVEVFKILPNGGVHAH